VVEVAVVAVQDLKLVKMVGLAVVVVGIAVAVLAYLGKALQVARDM
jgi:hypothetical protein